MMWNDPGGYGWHMGVGGWLLMSFVLIIALALLVGVVVLIVRSARPQHPAGPGDLDRRSPADATLDERYARGEIDAEEYRERKNVLHSD